LQHSIPTKERSGNNGWSEKCSTSENKKTGVYVSDTRVGGYIKVRSVDFEKGASEFSASIAAGVDGGILEVRLDKLDGNKIAEIEVPRTGGWEEFKTLTSKISESVSGVHDVYFVLRVKTLQPEEYFSILTIGVFRKNKLNSFVRINNVRFTSVSGFVKRKYL
jgi:hypothetical protein